MSNQKMEVLKDEIIKFMRGKYSLDEVPGKYYELDCLKFKQGNRTIVSINFLENHYDLQLIFGKKERDKFELNRDSFSKRVQNIYDNSETLHDGKWMMFSLCDVNFFNEIKDMILIKKNPNRKPLSKEKAVLGKCGHRCDLCVHYKEIAEEFRDMLIPHLNNVYGNNDWMMKCTGCDTEGCHCNVKGNKLCEPLKCLSEKALSVCMECSEYPCSKSTVGYKGLEHKAISKEDVTYAILPYVPNQYE